jgi:sensor histidine kinase YesM
MIVIKWIKLKKKIMITRKKQMLAKTENYVPHFLPNSMLTKY